MAKLIIRLTPALTALPSIAAGGIEPHALLDDVEEYALDSLAEVATVLAAGTTWTPSPSLG